MEGPEIADFVPLAYGVYVDVHITSLRSQSERNDTWSILLDFRVTDRSFTLLGNTAQGIKISSPRGGASLVCVLLQLQIYMPIIFANV